MRVFAILLFTNHLFAQNIDLGTWNIINLKYMHSEQISFFTETQLRSLKFFDHFHYYEIKGGFDYRLQKNVKLTLGAGTYQTYKEGGDFVLPKNNDELRVWPQITLSQNIGLLQVEQRYRAEMRFTSGGYRNRFRYRIGISYAFGHNKQGFKPFQVSASNELFFTNTEPFFERNRIIFNLNYKPYKSISFQLGYLHQFDYKINDETGRDFLIFGTYFEIPNTTDLLKFKRKP